MDYDTLSWAVTTVGAYQGKEYTVAEVEIWEVSLAGFSDSDVRDAITYLVATSTGYLKPGDVRVRINAVRAERLRASRPEPVPNVPPSDVAAFQRWFGIWREGILDGQPMASAIASADEWAKSNGVYKKADDAQDAPPQRERLNALIAGIGSPRVSVP